MSVTPGAGQDRRSGQADRAPHVDLPPAPNGRAAGGRDDAVQRRWGGSPVRPRVRSPQAVAIRRRSTAAWTGTAGRVWLGVALLAVVGIVVWVEIGMVREPADAGARAVAEVAPTTVPTQTPLPEIPRGPEVTASLLEANGPIAGCAFHARLDDLRARIGPGLVGDCVEDVRSGTHGEARQRTTEGELVWWEGDSRAVFADRVHTWITGPIRDRAAAQRGAVRLGAGRRRRAASHREHPRAAAAAARLDPAGPADRLLLRQPALQRDGRPGRAADGEAVPAPARPGRGVPRRRPRPARSRRPWSSSRWWRRASPARTACTASAWTPS